MRVLITGGTGFFGKAMTRRLLDRNLAESVCILSRDEAKQAVMRRQFNDDPRLRWFIGDVRDRQRLTKAFRGVHTVYAAAALKRIEVGHYNPDEMIKTNVIGSMNVIDAAIDAGVKKVVALSTDKAWQGGVSAYGQSKALAESLYRAADNTTGPEGPRFCAVRYGNIWRSTQSIVPIWEELIANGATSVPVTDPNCTRFFMSVDEAVDFVLEAERTMKGGELFIPETLPAYRVGDLAEAMGVAMDVRGLPFWERLHEGMRDGLTSDKARRMTVDELREALRHG